LSTYYDAGTATKALLTLQLEAGLREANADDALRTLRYEFAAVSSIRGAQGIIAQRLDRSDIAASDTSPSRVQRLDTIAARIKIPAQVSAEKLVAFLKEPPTEDPDLEARLKEIRSAILARSGVTDLTAESISPITRSRIAIAILGARGDQIGEKLEMLFPVGG